MKHLKNFKMFENFQGVQTLRDLIGNVETAHRYLGEIEYSLVETDKGVLVSGLSADELEDYLLDEEIEVENEDSNTATVAEKGRKNFPIYCLALDDSGKILALVPVPGDYQGCEFDGTTFKVFGHDGINDIDVTNRQGGFTDRADLDDDYLDDEDYY